MRKSQPLAIVLGNNELWVPPFENYFGNPQRYALGRMGGFERIRGCRTPADVKQLIEDINAFQSADQASDEFKTLGARLVENMTKNLYFIGTVNAPAPMIHRNALKTSPSSRRIPMNTTGRIRTGPHSGGWTTDTVVPDMKLFRAVVQTARSQSRKNRQMPTGGYPSNRVRTDTPHAAIRSFRVDASSDGDDHPDHCVTGCFHTDGAGAGDWRNAIWRSRTHKALAFLLRTSKTNGPGWGWIDRF